MSTMRFEKWQALGNDYLIVESTELPFELTPARVRKLCEGHFGIFADGVLLLSKAADPAHVLALALGEPADHQRRRVAAQGGSRGVDRTPRLRC